MVLPAASDAGNAAASAVMRDIIARDALFEACANILDI
jgi:hypothetical protein